MRTAEKVRLASVCVSIIVIGMMSAGISYAKIDPKTLLGMWLFDEDKGDVAEDSSLNDNNGVIKDAKWVDGKFGTALEFEGGVGGVAIEFDLMDLNKDQSFSAWFKTEFDQNYHALVFHSDMGGGYRFWMWIYRNGHGAKGKIGLGYRPGGEVGLEINSGIIVNDDAWHHAVAVFDQTAKQASLYVDGARRAQTTIAGLEFNETLGRLCVGNKCPGDVLPGAIDEVAVFNAALTEKDVQEIMNEGLEGALGLTAVEPAGKLATIWGAVKAQ